MHRHGLGKSVAHSQIQCHLKKWIGTLELEKTFEKRRADAVWEEKKIVFEIQISPISLEEASCRIQDYQLLGYQVVWILHDRVFNGHAVSPAEKFLREKHTTYFTSGGVIYDQMEAIRGKRRVFKGEQLPVDITLPSTPFIKVPYRCWSLQFIGDLHTFCATHGEKKVYQTLKSHMPAQGWRWWLQFVGFRILELVSTNQK